MRTALSALALGGAAFGALAVVAALVATALADASGRTTYELAVAGLELVSFERNANGTTTELGPGLAAIPLAGGFANAAAAVALAAVRRRSA